MSRRALSLMAAALLATFLVACDRGDSGGDTSPSIRDLAPGQVRNDRESLVMIVGANFAEGASVVLGPTRLPQSTFINEEMVTAVIPPGLAAGGYPLVVELPNGRVTQSRVLTVLNAAQAPPPPPPPPPPSPTRTATAAPTQQGTPTATAPSTPTRTPTAPPATPTAPPPTATAPPATATRTATVPATATATPQR